MSKTKEHIVLKDGDLEHLEAIRGLLITLSEADIAYCADNVRASLTTAHMVLDGIISGYKSEVG